MPQSNAILYRMPQGIPGAISRESVATIEAQALNPALPFAAYGLPGKMLAGAFVPITGAADAVYGFLVRPFPTTGLNPSDPLGSAVPPVSGVANIMRRGYMMVQSNAGVPASNGAVYVRYASGATLTPVDGLEAALVAATTVAIAGAAFMGPADASGMAEISFNI